MKKICLALGILFGSTANAADLLDIYRQALQQDAVFAGARSTWLAGQEKLPQARAGLLPNVSVNANTSLNRNDTTYQSTQFASGVSRFNSNSATIQATQPLFNVPNYVQYKQARHQLGQADAELYAASEDLIVRVAQAYFDVLLAQDTVAFAGAQKSAIGEQLAQAKRNFEVGIATITDTHEAQARYDLVVSQEIAAINELEIKQRALQQIIGQLPGPLAPLSKSVPLVPPEPNDMEKWVQEALKSSMQVQAQQAALEVATLEIAKNRGAHFPTIEAVASYGKNGSGATSLANTAVGTDTDTSAIGLQLNLPIFQGGLVNSRVREAVALRDRARNELENTRRSVTLAVNQAFLGVSSGAAQVRALEQALISNQSSLESTRLGQEVGVRTSVDVLNAQQQLFSARRDLSQARYNYLINQLKLKQAIGKLTEADLAAVNQWLGPK